jgi:hypothetical protein
MNAPRLLDLYCGAGGCSKGYADAGFEVVGVDIEPQPRYPFEFVQADVVESGLDLVERFKPDVIAASPPCQHDADVTAWRGNRADHPDLILPTKVILEASTLPYVVENVRGAVRNGKLRPDVMLCGSMFGLRVRRHRYFETTFPLLLSPSCRHRPDDFAFDHGAKQPESVYRDAMGCDWMTVAESREAIPPAYTAYIGEALVAHLQAVAA